MRWIATARHPQGITHERLSALGRALAQTCRVNAARWKQARLQAACAMRHVQACAWGALFLEILLAVCLLSPSSPVCRSVWGVPGGQIVRTVIAGGLLRSLEPLLQATSQAKQRQQATALAPIRYPLPTILMRCNSVSGARTHDCRLWSIPDQCPP